MQTLFTPYIMIESIKRQFVSLQQVKLLTLPFCDALLLSSRFFMVEF